MFHTLHTDTPPPRKFTYPFCYEPHPLCREAAAEVQRHIESSGVMSGEHGGKMFGVLVVRQKGVACGGGEDTQLGFVAAYSGLLSGRNDWPWFVPPVFDAQQPGGHFKTVEARISAINAEIAAISGSAEYAAAAENVSKTNALAAQETERMRREMAEAKQKRDARRASATEMSNEEKTAMERESQHMKAELRRARKHFDALCAEAEAHLKCLENRIEELRTARRDMSEDLQNWLFAQYRMLNARGERRDLCDIFAHTVHGKPPAGSGDCCAPKLLQYAFAHGLQPVCMAEFWWGPSPAGEIRHHLHYYPACRGKCLPILTHMLQGLDVEDNPLAQDDGGTLDILYEDDWLAVVCKSAGMLSVPGKEGRASVVSVMQSHWHGETEVMVAHRLDMDTSGLLVVARSREILAALQRQFERREVKKKYLAVIDGCPKRRGKGTVNLPLAPDPLDRPRQRVDFAEGKEAITGYELLQTDGQLTLVALYPHTGRTHQLRLHCAHADGLGCPIHGDPLYGQRADRLCLHAASITFTHPVTGRKMSFESAPQFSVMPRNGAAQGEKGYTAKV